MSMPDNEKRCSTCGETKPLAAFFKRNRGRDGYNSQCKVCVAKTSDQREADRERVRAWGQANRARHNANTYAYRQRNPDRKAAQNAVYNAIKRGDLTRLPCEVCGSELSQAHHDDYTRRLAVRWLCTQHHVEADMERRANV
jgi:uncharacterized protein (DUF983 family)